MSRDRNSIFDLHPATIIGSALGAGPARGPAAHDAEPEAQEPRRSPFRRLVAAFRARREAAARAEAGRA